MKLTFPALVATLMAVEAAGSVIRRDNDSNRIMFPQFSVGDLTFIPDASAPPLVASGYTPRLIDPNRLKPTIDSAIAEAKEGHDGNDRVPASYFWPHDNNARGSYRIEFSILEGHEIKYADLAAALDHLKQDVDGKPSLWTVSGNIQNPDHIGTYKVDLWF